MKHRLIGLTLLIFGCSEDKPFFTERDHDIIKSKITANYQQNRQSFQLLAKELAEFKTLRSIQFQYGRKGLDGISIYSEPIDGDTAGFSFIIQGLEDTRFQKILEVEGITQAAIENIKRRLDKINCNSFYTSRHSNSNTGTSYVHVEFKYNDWNGANFYFYKVFDRKMEQDMVQFFDRKKVVMGTLKNTGSVLDSNAVWYLPTD